MRRLYIWGYKFIIISFTRFLIQSQISRSFTRFLNLQWEESAKNQRVSMCMRNTRLPIKTEQPSSVISYKLTIIFGSSSITCFSQDSRTKTFS